MAAPSCPGCQQRDETLAELRARLAALEDRVRQLEAQAGRNATNSSLPPSANPPGAPKLPPRKPSGRKTGGQPGHPAHLRRRLPPQRVQHSRDLFPSQCQRCREPLSPLPAPGDPEPTWHQVAELPELAAEVTEYRGHFRTCPCCGTLNHAAIPADLKAHSVGPRLAATLSYLAGRHHLSQRGLEELAEDVFDVPLSLGTVGHLAFQASAALAPAHAEAVQAVRQAAVKNVDETSWKLAGGRCWLWAAATATVAAFAIHARRSAAGLAGLLGEVIAGVVGSDRWGVYRKVAPDRWQVCWAHLKRDFQAMVDRNNAGSAIGEELLLLTGVLFGWWHRVRDGTLSRRAFRRYADSLRDDVLAVLGQGRACGCAKTAATCRELLAVEESLWTFVRVEGVEPTNNHIERVLRLAVLWRKKSFGSQSEAGCRFVERLLTVVQTRRLQGRSVMDYLYEALVAHRAGLPAPKLIPHPN
jgi:transposase